MERHLFQPILLAELEHALSHHIRAGALEAALAATAPIAASPSKVAATLPDTFPTR